MLTIKPIENRLTNERVLHIDSKPFALGNMRPEPLEKLFDRPLIFSWPQKSISKGLINLGNTCFMASVVQCMQHIPSFNSYLMRQHEQHCKSPKEKCTICTFNRLTKRCFHSQQPVKPIEMAFNLENIASHLTLGKQEDAHDFLHCLLNKMQDHLVLGLTPKPDQHTEMTTGVGQIFGGFLRSQIVCLGCNKASNNYESLFSISLGISSVSTLKDALDKFVETDNMGDEEWYSCDICKIKRRASKTYSVDNPPRTLILHLKRYDKITKISHNVKFGNMLDLSPYVSKDQLGSRKVMYELSSVLVHHGITVNMGHYYSFVSNPSTYGRIRTKEWYAMNDGLVTRVTWEKVKSSQAYILFYVRTDCKPWNNITHSVAKHLIPPNIEQNSEQKSLTTPTVAQDIVNNIQMGEPMQLSDSQHCIKNTLVKLVPYEYCEESELKFGEFKCHTEQALPPLSPAKRSITQNVEDQTDDILSFKIPSLQQSKAFRDAIQRSSSKVKSNTNNVEELHSNSQDDNQQDTYLNQSKACYNSSVRKSRSPSLREINDKENKSGLRNRSGSRRRRYKSNSRSRSRSRRRYKSRSRRRRYKSGSRSRSRSRRRRYKSGSRSRSRSRRRRYNSSSRSRSRSRRRRYNSSSRSRSTSRRKHRSRLRRSRSRSKSRSRSRSMSSSKVTNKNRFRNSLSRRRFKQHKHKLISRRRSRKEHISNSISRSTSRSLGRNRLRRSRSNRRNRSRSRSRSSSRTKNNYRFRLRDQ